MKTSEAAGQSGRFCIFFTWLVNTRSGVYHPSMIRKTDTQTLDLTGLDQGHRYALVITGAESDVALEFKHAGDATWRTLPTFDGTMADVIAGDFFCFTPTMRLNFASAPTQPYYVSCVCAAVATF